MNVFQFRISDRGSYLQTDQQPELASITRTFCIDNHELNKIFTIKYQNLCSKSVCETEYNNNHNHF